MTRDPAFGSVLVFGASSQIGHYLLPMFVGGNTRVFAVSRAQREAAAQADSSRATSRVTWLRGSLPDACPSAIDDADAVISFGPLDVLVRWLQRPSLPSLRRVIATSSMSAHSKRTSPVAVERAVAQGLRDAEAALAEVCGTRGIDWTILRPTLIYGAGGDRSLTPIAQRAVRWRVFALPHGEGLRQPVHAQDIALAVLAALRTSAGADRIMPIGGGERLTAAQMFARVRASLPVSTLPLPLPRFASAAVARMLPAWRGALSRLDQDLIADNTDLENLLDVHPRGFKPDARCWGL